MVDIFCIIEFLLMILYGCIAYKMKKADKVLGKNHPDISRAKLYQWMNSLTEKETALTIRPGKLYGYNPRKKELLFIEKIGTVYMMSLVFISNWGIIMMT